MCAGVSSHLGRDHDEEMADAIAKTSTYWKTPDEGASTTMVAALDPALNGRALHIHLLMIILICVLDRAGLYMSDCQFFPCADYAKDPEIAARLWKLSEELIGEKFDL